MLFYQSQIGQIQNAVQLIDNTYRQMGQKTAKVDRAENVSEDQLQKSITSLFGADIKGYTLDSVISPIIMISKHISERGSFTKTQEGLEVNIALLRCIYHPQFQHSLKALMILLGKELKGIMASQLIALVPRQKFKRCINLAHFCIFFTDYNLIQTVNLLGIRSDLHPNTKSIITQLSKDTPQLNLSILSVFQLQELSELTKIFRISLGMMIDLHLKILTRSDFTLKLVDLLNQSVFIIFCKIFFSSSGQLSKRQRHQNSKSLVKIGAYFLGLGLQNKIASIYETAIILLASVLQSCAENIKQGKALPSHLFKNLPIINSNQSIDWITYNVLFALKCVKTGTKVSSKLNINRIPSLKLLQLIFKRLKPQGQQITFMLEQICLQTKPGQIERVYISYLADMYAKLQNINSEIIVKYSQVREVSYNVKSSNRSLKVKPEQIITQLENDDDTFQKQMNGLSAKFVSQVIFQKDDVVYEYSDKSLWNLILYNLQTGSTHGDLDEGGKLDEE